VFFFFFLSTTFTLFHTKLNTRKTNCHKIIIWHCTAFTNIRSKMAAITPHRVTKVHFEPFSSYYMLLNKLTLQKNKKQTNQRNRKKENKHIVIKYW
jgi:hypothetical protein